MSKNYIKKILISFILVLMSLQANVLAQVNDTVIYPSEYSRALRNPMMGYKEWGTNRANEWATTGKYYIPWNILENSASDGNGKIINWTNNHLAGIDLENFKIIPRVYLDYPGLDPAWPDDMTDGDYSSEQFKTRLRSFVKKLGACWDDDPRIAYIEMGIIGKWGEHHAPFPDAEMQDLLAEIFMDAFKNKKITRRYPDHFAAYDFGFYWDSFAHYDDIQTFRPGVQEYGDYWKTQIMQGEPAYNWGNRAIQPGDNPDDNLLDPVHRNFLIDAIKEFHCSGLGWVSQYDKSDPAVTLEAEKVQLAFGYRFVIDEFKYPLSIEKGTPFNVSLVVTNRGSAPFYHDWPVELSLLDEHKKVVWKQNFSDVDIRTWYPGDDYNNSTKEYDVGPLPNNISSSFIINEALASGKYTIAVSVLDPAGNLPSLRFAIDNYFKGAYHPMGKVGVDTTLTYHGIDPGDFDDMYNDHSMHYVAVDRPVYTLTTHVQGSGSVFPMSSSYGKGDSVAIRATPDDGWWFSGWEGDLGTDNPIHMVMDTNKVVTAIFKPNSPVSLSTSIASGSGSIEPSDGTYNEGDVLYILAQADSAYVFSHWGGDLSGSANPASLTMNGDKHVSAAFTEAASYILSTGTDGNGSISLAPSRDQYTDGAIVTLSPIPNPGYSFDSWGGDLSGSANPAIITMDDHKSVTASFTRDNSLIGYWSMDETSGSVARDSSSNGLDADLKGGPFFSAGALNNALDLSGSQDGTITSPGALGTLSSLTVASYVKANASNTQWAWIAAHGDNYGFYITSDGNVQLYYYDGSDWTGVIGSMNIVDDKWHHVAGTFDQVNGTINIYVDGQLDGTGQVSGSVAYQLGTSFTIGSMQGDRYFKGSLDELKVYNRALNQSEIAAMLVFEAPSFTLSTSVTGLGSIDPPGGTYFINSGVSLTATADAGYTFESWGGDLAGSENPVTIVMDANKIVTAAFTSNTSVKESEPDDLKLQVYPNPATHAATIIYSLQNASFVELSIYNMQGKEEVILVNTQQDAGVYNVDLTQDHIPLARFKSGLYFCRLQIGAKSLTAKIIFN